MDIRAGRCALSMSQEKLAELCGVTQGTVSRWERGEVEPRHAPMIVLKQLFSNRAPDPIELRELAALRGLTLSVDMRGLWTVTRVVGKSLTSAQAKALLA